MYTIKDLYDLEHTLAADYLKQFTYPWEALKGIKEMIISLGSKLGDEYQEVQPQVWVHQTATVFPSAYLGAPCIIGPRTEVRHCAFIRGISGKNIRVIPCGKRVTVAAGQINAAFGLPSEEIKSFPRRDGQTEIITVGHVLF